MTLNQKNEPNLVVLGLGSNQGNRITSLRTALQKLKSPEDSPQIDVLKISPIYESDALLPAEAPKSWKLPFLNINVLCRTSLSPLELLHHVKALEKQMGRTETGRWAPRLIDIDLLTLQNQNFSHELLELPHPGLLERPFALLPLADLVPQWRYSGPGRAFGQTFAELAAPYRHQTLSEVPFQTHRSHLTLVECVGILNLTPDSFSDGGEFSHPAAVLAGIEKMLKEGIRIFDLGAESTRPGATPLSPSEEWARLGPVLHALREADFSIPFLLSVDTRHPEVATQAIEYGVHWINDVSGFSESRMQNVAAHSTVDLVMMHSLTVPAQRNTYLPPHVDPVGVLKQWADRRIQELLQLGVTRERIIFDPGLGFGKSFEQSWEILRRIREFQDLGVRIFVGHSRKSFLSTLTSLPAAERDLETITLSLSLATQGVDYLRVHATGLHQRMLKAWAQSSGIVENRPWEPKTFSRGL